MLDEWATLSYDARRKAGQRDRVRLKRYLEANSFRSCDIADVLYSLGLVEPLAKTKPFFNIHFFEVRVLISRWRRSTSVSPLACSCTTTCA